MKKLSLLVRVSVLLLVSATAWTVAQEPSATPPSPAPQQSAASVEPEAPAVPPPSINEAVAPSIPIEKSHPPSRDRKKSNRQGSVTLGQHVVVPADESVESVVNFLGTAEIAGTVHDAVVTIGGSSSITGSVGDAVVAVLGNINVDGAVRGDVVSVGGGVVLGPNARVAGEVVSVGGSVNRHPGAVVQGEVVSLGFLERLPDFGRLGVWFEKAFLRGRPLAIDARLGWAWAIAGSFLAFYLLTALLLNNAVTRCAETLEQRPGRTILAAFLVALFTPLFAALLLVTVVGPAVLFFVLIVANLFGKAAFLAWLGRRITRPLGIQHAMPAVLIGGVLLTLGYLVPFLGFILFKASDMLGLGMVVYTIMLATQREKPPGSPSATAVSSPASNATIAPAPFSTSAFTAGPVAAAAAIGTEAQPASAAIVNAVPAPGIPPISYASLPRAGFGIRLGASFLDLMIVGAISTMIQLGGLMPLIYAAYCVVMWTLKSTTIGGIVCGLKVVRLDERPMDWGIALVRGLGGFLSLSVGGLGFIWVAFDEQQQSWHDKIAGTVIVHAPKGMSLI